MPQLVKGGKHTFGWSLVGGDGTIPIPPDAFSEYRFDEVDHGILMSGSKKSGGFGLTSPGLLKQSPLAGMIDEHPELADGSSCQGQPIVVNNRVFCRVSIREARITVPLDTLQMYGICAGDSLLTVRGSNLALGFIVRGPIIEEARKHPEIETYK